MHSYHWLSYKQKNQLQPMAGYKQTKIHYWAQVSQGDRKPPQTEDNYDNQSMLTLYLLFYA